jgi:hypothetical protein
MGLGQVGIDGVTENSLAVIAVGGKNCRLWHGAVVQLSFGRSMSTQGVWDLTNLGRRLRLA